MWHITLAELYSTWALHIGCKCSTLALYYITDFTWRGEHYNTQHYLERLPLHDNTQHKSSPIGGTLSSRPLCVTILWLWAAINKRWVVRSTTINKNFRNLLGHEDKLLHSPSKWAGRKNIWSLFDKQVGKFISWSWATLHKHWALGFTPEEVDKYIPGDLQVLKLLQHYRKMSLDPGKVFDFRR